MPKDGCNNMEKNAILRFHDAGEKTPDIARKLRLTERIVESMISHHRPDSKPKKAKKSKAKKKIDTSLNDSAEAADEFEEASGSDEK